VRTTAWLWEAPPAAAASTPGLAASSMQLGCMAGDLTTAASTPASPCRHRN
jgi:hypothetical protein